MFPDDYFGARSCIEAEVYDTNSDNRKKFSSIWFLFVGVIVGEVYYFPVICYWDK